MLYYWFFVVFVLWMDVLIWVWVLLNKFSFYCMLNFVFCWVVIKVVLVVLVNFNELLCCIFVFFDIVGFKFVLFRLVWVWDWKSVVFVFFKWGWLFCVDLIKLIKCVFLDCCY